MYMYKFYCSFCWAELKRIDNSPWPFLKDNFFCVNKGCKDYGWEVDPKFALTEDEVKDDN